MELLNSSSSETSNNFVTPELIKENYIKNEKIIGIGETGLDFFIIIVTKKHKFQILKNIYKQQ